MNETPILFSGPMVLAILAGIKTQTRRVLTPQPNGPIQDVDGFLGVKFNGRWHDCPYGEAGDRLWVREGWRIGAWNQDECAFAIDYRADGFCRREWLNCPDEEMFERLWRQSTDDAEAAGRKLSTTGTYRWKPGQSPCRWRPSLFMPRWASRITLEVVRIWIERLQEISYQDAVAEGIASEYPNAVAEYRALWQHINTKRGFGWQTDPWVWVMEFKVNRKLSFL